MKQKLLIAASVGMLLAMVAGMAKIVLDILVEAISNG